MGASGAILGGGGLPGARPLPWIPGAISPEEPTTGFNPRLDYGGSADLFGHKDYYESLREVQGEGDAALRQRRADIMGWLDTDAGQAALADKHKRGVAGGLHAEIASGAIGTKGRIADANTSAGDWFGHADWLGARAAGHSNKSMKEWLDANTGKVRGRNVAGSGGLYDQIASGARLEDTHHDYRTSFGEGIRQLTTDITDAWKKQDELYGEKFKGFQKEQEKFQQESKDWQRRQQQLTQQMQIAQMKAAKQKPVTTIMPPGTFGGGMSAKSLSRKKSLVKSLNI